jgi:hypothetical protein
MRQIFLTKWKLYEEKKPLWGSQTQEIHYPKTGNPPSGRPQAYHPDASHKKAEKERKKSRKIFPK